MIRSIEDAAKLPTLSVVMPNHNHGHYIAEALEAILAQSHLPDEVIVVDDRSTDDSVQVIRGFVERFPRVRLVTNPERLGPNRAIQRGVDEASGDFVFLPAADDRVRPGLFEKSLRLLAEHPQANVCVSDPSLFWEDGTVRTLHVLLTAEPTYIGGEALVDLYRRGAIVRLIGAASSLVRRSAFNAVGGFRADNRWYADFFAVTVIGFRTGVCYLPEPLTLFRIVEGSYAATGLRQRSKDVEVLANMLALLQTPAFEDVRPSFKRSAVFGCFGANLLRLGLTRPELREFLTGLALRRALWYAAKQKLYFLSPPRLRPVYHNVARAIRFLRGARPTL